MEEPEGYPDCCSLCCRRCDAQSPPQRGADQSSALQLPDARVYPSAFDSFGRHLFRAAAGHAYWQTFVRWWRCSLYLEPVWSRIDASKIVGRDALDGSQKSVRMFRMIAQLGVEASFLLYPGTFASRTVVYVGACHRYQLRKPCRCQRLPAGHRARRWGSGNSLRASRSADLVPVPAIAGRYDVPHEDVLAAGSPIRNQLLICWDVEHPVHDV